MLTAPINIFHLVFVTRVMRFKPGSVAGFLPSHFTVSFVLTQLVFASLFNTVLKHPATKHGLQSG